MRARREARETGGAGRPPGRATGALIVAALIVVVVLGAFFIRRMFLAAPVDASLEHESGFAKQGGRIQVSVVNAAGGQNLARRTMDYLRARGFDVVEIGNARDREPRSLIIDRANDSVSARKVAYALGIGDSCIRVQIDSMAFLQVNVVLGEDYARLKPWR